jgi:hypothetical protein
LWNNGTNKTYFEQRNVSCDYIAETDFDRDGIPNTNDRLQGDEEDVVTTGISNLIISIAGSNNLSRSFEARQPVLFYNSQTLLVNFTHNFSASVMDLRNVSIKLTSTSLIVKLSNQLLSNEYKSMYIADNNFSRLCVKDIEIDSVSEISSLCNQANEINFTACLGNSVGLTINTITCYDEGSRIRIERLKHSGIRGVRISPTTSGNTSSTQGLIVTNICKRIWVCGEWSTCTPEGKQDRICRDISKCDNKTNVIIQDDGKPEEIRSCGYASTVEIPNITENIDEAAADVYENITESITNIGEESKVAVEEKPGIVSGEKVVRNITWDMNGTRIRETITDNLTNIFFLIILEIVVILIYLRRHGINPIKKFKERFKKQGNN